MARLQATRGGKLPPQEGQRLNRVEKPSDADLTTGAMIGQSPRAWRAVPFMLLSDDGPSPLSSAIVGPRCVPRHYNLFPTRDSVLTALTEADRSSKASTRASTGVTLREFASRYGTDQN